jgi:CRISPR-associated protein Csd2
VTDVCLKRKVRNYVELAKEEENGFHIYVKEKAVLNRQNKMAYDALELKPESKKLPKKEEDARNVTKWMCQNFYDVRTFGAVMTTDVNCGQVRGPIQINFSKSLSPVTPLEVSITRMAVTHEKDLEKERTMGRKHIIPYGLYRVEGYISAKLAEKTGFSEADLQLFKDALINMFDHDHSAARGKMNSRKLFFFKHDAKLGNAPAHKLFDLIKSEAKADTPREFADFSISADKTSVPEGVEFQEIL